MMRSMAFSDVKKFFLCWRKELVGLAVLVGLACAILLLLWQLGQVEFVKGKITPVQIITALFVLAGLYWTARRVLATEKNVGVAEEGQVTERFTRAIEQLGNDKWQFGWVGFMPWNGLQKIQRKTTARSWKS